MPSPASYEHITKFTQQLEHMNPKPPWRYARSQVVEGCIQVGQYGRKKPSTSASFTRASKRPNTILCEVQPQQFVSPEEYLVHYSVDTASGCDSRVYCRPSS
ncbi:hypothetical protein SLA2020_273680 [Shorea laevis]